MSGGLVISIDRPSAPDVAALIATHLAFSRAVTPPEDVFAMDAAGLDAPDITLFSAREAGALLGIGALRERDRECGEIKSMHTDHAARGRGVGQAMLTHLLTVAHARGYARVVLETGPMEAFAAARALYRSAGFVDVPPFPPYGPNSVCMELRLGARP